MGRFDDVADINHLKRGVRNAFKENNPRVTANGRVPSRIVHAVNKRNFDAEPR